MKLYTLISIALSVFGGTYAAMAALRTRFEVLIKKTEEDAEIHLKKVSEHFGPSNQITLIADNHKKWISISSKLWSRCNTIPTILFAFLVFGIAIWTIFKWTDLCTGGDEIDLIKCPTTAFLFWFGLIVLVGTDFLCFVGAAVAWLMCKYEGKVLKQQYDAVLEEDRKKITIA